MKTIKKTIHSQTEQLADLLDSGFFRALSEPVRVQILKYLLLHGRSDISSIEKAFKQDRSVISRHLRTMLDAGLLLGEKQDRHQYYSVHAGEILTTMEAMVKSIRACIQACCPEFLEKQ